MKGDQLIAVLSTRGTMPRLGPNGFDSACAYLCPANAVQFNDPHKYLSRNLLNCLSELGFCEQVGYGNTMEIKVAKPVLARLPSVGIRAVLCGARTPAFQDTFRSECAQLGLPLEEAADSVPNHPLFHELVPSPISVFVQDASLLAELAHKVGLPSPEQPPAWQALWASPSHEVVNFWQFNNANEQVMQGVAHKFFSPETLLWKGGDSNSITFGYALGRLGYDFTLYLRENGILKTANSSNERPLDLSWAKWLIIKQAGHLLAAYDPKRRRFVIPNWCPLPTLLGRALALCSGRSPRVWWGRDSYNITAPLSKHELRVYEGVPPVFSRLIGEKLGMIIPNCDVLTNTEAIKENYA